MKVDDRVRIVVTNVPEHLGRVATIGSVLSHGWVILYFGDQDEDDYMYEETALELL